MVKKSLIALQFPQTPIHTRCLSPAPLAIVEDRLFSVFDRPPGFANKITALRQRKTSNMRRLSAAILGGTAPRNDDCGRPCAAQNPTTQPGITVPQAEQPQGAPTQQRAQAPVATHCGTGRERCRNPPAAASGREDGRHPPLGSHWRQDTDLYRHRKHLYRSRGGWNAQGDVLLRGLYEGWRRRRLRPSRFIRL